MKLSHLQDQSRSFSFHDPATKDRTHLEPEIKQFLTEVARRPVSHRVCPCCGRQMQYINTVFSLFGENCSWDIRLPVCPCGVTYQNA